MPKQNVIIAGSSGHLKVVIDILEQENNSSILGILDQGKKIGEEVFGYKIIGKDEDLPELVYAHGDCKLFVAVGDNWIRKKIVDKLIAISPNIDFMSTVHPSAQIGKNVQIGKGVVVMPGAVINCDSKIGDFTIINTNASVDHDCIMQNFSSIGPNATLGGNVTVGEYSVISIGTTIKHGIKIGNHSIIGAGALLMKNCGDNLIMYGIPAKEIRKRQIGEKYL